jgi:hypothetical protein
MQAVLLHGLVGPPKEREQGQACMVGVVAP